MPINRVPPDKCRNLLKENSHIKHFVVCLPNGTLLDKQENKYKGAVDVIDKNHHPCAKIGFYENLDLPAGAHYAPKNDIQDNKLSGELHSALDRGQPRPSVSAETYPSRPIRKHSLPFNDIDAVSELLDGCALDCILTNKDNSNSDAPETHLTRSSASQDSPQILNSSSQTPRLKVSRIICKLLNKQNVLHTPICKFEATTDATDFNFRVLERNGFDLGSILRKGKQFVYNDIRFKIQGYS